MAQSALNYASKWRGGHHNCTAKDLVNGQIRRTGLANGVIIRYGWSAGECTPLGTRYGPKPRCMNGYMNHGYKGKSTKTAPPKKLWTKDSLPSIVTNGSAAETIRSTVVPDGISANGALFGNFDQVVPDPRLSVSQNKQSKKKFRYKKKRNEEVASQGRSALPLQEKEDWEKEIEVTPKDREKMCFGIVPFGPEDSLSCALRDLRLQHGGVVDSPLTTNYIPAKHHPRPIQWTRYRIPTELDQFADADE
ncbi:uncharacterized protein LOC121638588 [Melanotaenia boesemani]|uniref:uncharacterized protein LOC121638588 n=1 Tax=Melanotaenia boesemani TaxID=1250792 RepID=UPI001C03FC4C|nr:uncharacterized protein LOC121638588 [Melanotaenia boesemani]